MIDTMIEPTLTLTDWNGEWVALQKARKHPDSAAYWDERSKTFHKASPSSYSSDFIRLLALDPDDTVFDMGCGNGAISIPLAAAWHKVVAADFSRGMLDSLQEQAREQGVEGIDVRQVSWEDDWQAAGITPGFVDVAVASRSIVTADLRDSLGRMSKVARKRCAITLPTGNSPRADADILKAIGLQPRLRSDYLYAFMILAQMGYTPRVDYIPSTRFDSWDSFEAAYESLKKMVDDTAADILPEQDVEGGLERLRSWLKDNLVDNPEAGQINEFGDSQGKYMLAHHRKITWAFISWEV
jgi:SAM-dependent methyltransferase